MKYFLSILFLALFVAVLMSSRKTFELSPNYRYGVDTPIVGLVYPDQIEIDTNSLPPTDTIPTSSGPRNNLIFEELYNDASIDPKVKGFQTSGGSCCAWSQVLSDSFFNTSPTSNRFEIRITDPLVGGSHRSEDNLQSNGEPVLNFERWLGEKVYFPVGYTKDRSPEAFTQFHAADNNPPPVALWTLNDNIYFAFNGGISGPSYGAVPKGSWVSFVFHIRWDTDGTHGGGLIEIWMNGVLMTQKVGNNSPPGLAYGPYPKWGIYKWPWIHLDRYTTDIDVRSLYIDDVRYGSALATYSDVAPS